MASSKCETCAKTVYPMEKLSVEGKAYHKLCFKCNGCSERLTLRTFKREGGKVYCKKCVPQHKIVQSATTMEMERAKKAPKLRGAMGLDRNKRMTFAPRDLGEDFQAQIAAAEAGGDGGMGGAGGSLVSSEPAPAAAEPAAEPAPIAAAEPTPAPAAEPAATSTADESGPPAGGDGDLFARMQAARDKRLAAIEKYRTIADDFDGLTGDQKADAVEMFTAFDADGSGSLDTSELAKACAQLGLQFTTASLGDLIAKVDANGSGSVEFGEWLEVGKGVALAPPEGSYESDLIARMQAVNAKRDELRKTLELELKKPLFDFLTRQQGQDALQLFLAVDEDASGTLDRSELHCALLQLGIASDEAGVDKALADFDANSDGVLSFREFLELYTSMAEAQAAATRIQALYRGRKVRTAK